MKSKKVPAILIIVLLLSLGVLCQNSRYPNELKGFELMKTSKLKTLVPGISTKSDVLKTFGEECKKHERLGICELDENWYVSFSYGETDTNILWSIEFYPHRRIPFSKVKFPKRFERGDMMIVHLPIEIDRFISRSDKHGLTYVIINEKGDGEFRKGDLFYIEYGLPEKLR